MKIVVNTRLLRKNQMDGIGWFTYNTLRYIVRQNSQIEFHFLFDSDIDQEFLFADNIVPHKLFPPAKHAILNIVWFEYSVRKQLKRIKPDLFFSPDGILCLGWNGKQHGVIHDINFHHHPEYLKFSNRKYYNYFFPKFIKKATRLATVSKYSKKDICTTYSAETDKIDIVYSGVNSFYKPVDESKKAKIRDQYADGKPYFVFIGALSPRKNIVGMMKAFELFKKRTGNETRLLIVGKEMYGTAEMQQCKKKLQFGRDIMFTGRMSDAVINDILGSALALVFVPFFEGFGLPPVEAMQCDVPVIASNVTSVPEVTGDAALMVDPFNIHSIADAMINVQQSSELRFDLIKKGRVRKEFFSWEKTAELLWESMHKCI